jgi:hypothetical protein
MGADSPSLRAAPNERSTGSFPSPVGDVGTTPLVDADGPSDLARLTGRIRCRSGRGHHSRARLGRGPIYGVTCRRRRLSPRALAGTPSSDSWSARSSRARCQVVKPPRSARRCSTRPEGQSCSRRPVRPARTVRRRCRPGPPTAREAEGCGVRRLETWVTRFRHWYLAGSWIPLLALHASAPSQMTRVSPSLSKSFDQLRTHQAGISPLAPPRLAPRLQSLPAMLHRQIQI